MDAARTIAREVQRCARLWSLPDLVGDTRVEFSQRLRASLGRSYPSRMLIRLHPGLADQWVGLLPEVVCHELAHLGVHVQGGGRAHGAQWRALMEQAGYVPRPRLRPEGAPPARSRGPRPLYRHRCPVCQSHRSSVRRVPAWRCQACLEVGLEGRLVIERQDQVL